MHPSALSTPRLVVPALASAALIGAQAMPATALPATGGGAVAPEAAAAQPATVFPATCESFALLTTPAGAMSVVSQKGTAFARVQVAKVPFVPKRATYLWGTTGADGSLGMVILSTDTNGALWRVVSRTTWVGGKPVVAWQTVTKLRASGWQNIRVLASAYPYVYAISGSAAYRYSLATGYNPTKPVRLASTGFGTVRAMSVAPLKKLTGTRVADPIVTLDGDKVLEYTVPRDKPTTFTKSVLKASGWSIFPHVTVGGCKSPAAARSMVGFTAAGVAFGYYDPNAKDLSGKDWKSIGRIGTGLIGRLSD